MSAEPAERRALAEFCESLPELRRQASGEGWQDELDEKCSQLRAADRPATEIIKALLGMLGLAAVARGSGGLVSLLGARKAPPPAGAYRCPRDRCSRTREREPSGPISRCSLFSEPLRFGAP